MKTIDSSDDLYVQCLFSFGQMIDDGLVYHEHKDTDEVRIYIGAITTINGDQGELPQVEFGGKGKLIIMNDNPDGEKTCVNIEGKRFVIS